MKPKTSKAKATQKKKETAAEEYVPEHPWDRQPDENQQQYEKFCAYRDMKYEKAANGIPQVDIFRSRSIRKLSADAKCNRTLIEKLSARFRWQARCDAYDLYITKLQRDENEKNIRDMQKRHAQIASEILKKAVRRILSLPDEEISAGDLVRMADVGVKIERLARGESTENQRITGEIEEKKTVTVSVEDELKELSVSVLRKMAEEYKAKPVEELPTEKILELLREEGEKRP